MSYQKCPACGGTGIDQSIRVANTSAPTCPVCNGRRIISSVTGLPSNGSNNIKNFEETDFRDIKKESQQEYFGK